MQKDKQIFITKEAKSLLTDEELENLKRLDIKEACNKYKLKSDLLENITIYSTLEQNNVLFNYFNNRKKGLIKL